MKLARIIFSGSLLILGILLALRTGAEGPARQDTKGSGSESFHVVGYLPDYRTASFDAGQAKYLTDLIYFSAEPEASGELNRKRLRPEALRMLRRVKDEQKVRLLLCVGGWDRSAAFAELAASPRARQRFADTLTAFCTDNQFDGIDLDWEHPANEAQQKDYAALLAEVKKAFAPRRLLLTIAMAGWQQLPADAFVAVDRVHLMAYDARGRHSTPEFAEAEVGRLLKKQIPPGKICLGLPFYGKSIDGRVRTLTYAQIVGKYRPAADVDEVDGVYFNGIQTVQRKTRYAREHKLAGVMVWEIGQDASDQHSLLRAIHQVVSASDPGR
jgi:chitinase